MPRLPQPGGDQGQWGHLLNDYLSQSHHDDGSLKAGTVGASQLQNNAITENKLDASVIAKLNSSGSGGSGGSVTSVAGKTGVVTLTSADVGLNSVNNTPDATKPISSATQAALDAKINTSEKGVANGVASLGQSGLVPMAQLASGTASGSTYLRGDGVWGTPGGSGGGGTVAWDDVTDKPLVIAAAATQEAARTTIGAAAATHTHPIAAITATGTPSATTYLRGDGSWSTPATGGGGGGGDIDEEAAALLADSESALSVALATTITKHNGHVELSTVPGFTSGMNATTLLQGLINNTAIRSISINAPIQISTVSIPINRPLRIHSERFTSVAGAAPLITIIAGGEGIKLNGSGANMVVGIQLENLSFTSNDVSVVGAITGQDATGVEFRSLYFANVAGSAIAITGNWYDSAISDLCAMDCGRAGIPVVRVGADGAGDPNRLVVTNMRIERSKSTQLFLSSGSYNNDFIGCKFHGEVTDHLPAVRIGGYDNRVTGGQIFIAPGDTGIRITGTRNLIDGVSFNSPLGFDGERGVDIQSIQNTVTHCRMVNIFEPLVGTAAAEGLVFANNQLTVCGQVRPGAPFARIIGNVSVAGSVSGAATPALFLLPSYAFCEGNVINAPATGTTYGFVTEATMDQVLNNHVFGANLTHAVWLQGDNHIVRGNFARNITGSVVHQSNADGTRIVADNVKV